MMDSLRRWRMGLSLCTALAVTACVHAPADRSEERRATGATSRSAVPPVDRSATYPSATLPPAVQRPPVLGPDEAETAEGLIAEQHADLFDRMRVGFQLPDIEHDAIRQQVEWYAARPDYLERAFGRAELYLYHIVTELEARGLPLELALLPVIESAFQPFAYSRAHASGLWQFIPGTGTRFGLKQNWWYDGRRDVIESTRAALEYLKALHDEFDGDWLLAIAAYNCGERRVAREIAENREAGKPTDFWSLRLPSETRAYVPKLLAMKRLVADPGRYGLTISPIPNQPYFARVETYGQIDLKVAAEIAGIGFDELFELNPAFHRWATDPAGPHFLLLPVEAAEVFKQNILTLTPDQRMRVARHTVREGESLAAIARRYNTTTNAIRELNDLRSGPLLAGTELRVPSETVALPSAVARAAALIDGGRAGRDAARPRVHVVKRGESLWRIARNNGMDVHTLATMNGMSPNDTLRAGQRLRLGGSSAERSASGAAGRIVTYVVRRGDTLYRIARLFQVSVAQIASWNSLRPGAPIMPGQRLTIRVSERRS